MRPIARIQIIALALALPVNAFAQVNTEKLRETHREEGFSGNVSGSLTYRTGNVDRLRVGSGVRLQYETLHPVGTSSTAPRATKDLFFVVANQTFANKRTSDEMTERFINKGFTHLRWTRMWVPRLGSEVFSQVEYNEFLRLEARLLGGLGLRASLLESKHADAYAGAGYMLEHEKLDRPDSCEDTPTDSCLNHRLTSYFGFSVKVWDDELALINTVYFQPRIDDFDDFRLLSEGGLSVTVAKKFSLGISVNLRYDNQPPEEVEQLDIQVTNKVTYKF